MAKYYQKFFDKNVIAITFPTAKNVALIAITFPTAKNVACVPRQVVQPGLRIMSSLITFPTAQNVA